MVTMSMSMSEDIVRLERVSLVLNKQGKTSSKVLACERIGMLSHWEWRSE